MMGGWWTRTRTFNTKGTTMLQQQWTSWKTFSCKGYKDPCTVQFLAITNKEGHVFIYDHQMRFFGSWRKVEGFLRSYRISGMGLALTSAVPQHPSEKK